MRIVWWVLLAVTAGCAGQRSNLSKPRAAVETLGEVQQGIFSADGKAFLGWVTPIGKDPAAERLKPHVIRTMTSARLSMR